MIRFLIKVLILPQSHVLPQPRVPQSIRPPAQSQPNPIIIPSHTQHRFTGSMSQGTFSLTRMHPHPTPIQQRVQRVADAREGRQDRILRLDHHMRPLRRACGFCLVRHRRITCHSHMSVCDSIGGFPRNWESLKSLFKYDKFEACHYCGCPQERSHNGEVPACHAQFRYGSKQPCDWDNLPYVIVWSIWHIPEIRRSMLARFNLPATISYSEFGAWIIKADEEAGEFRKLIEVFIWYCETSSIHWHN